MLAFVLRGIVLVVVLGWYSTSVWKMIDGYFKDRFDKYLKDEFAKNPRMKADMAGHNRGKVPIDVATSREFLDSCQLDTCPVDKVVTLEKDKISPAAVNEGQINPVKAEENMSNISPNGDNLRMVEKKEKIDKSASSSPDVEHQKTTTRVKKKILLPIQELPKSRQRQKVKTIMLTEDDFEEVKKKMAIDDDDFTEFENEGPPPEGILVSKLGFKPKADIGNLDRVTEDEFCPISLDYEGDCSETKSWS